MHQHATRKLIIFLITASFLILISSLSFQSCQEATAPKTDVTTNKPSSLSQKTIDTQLKHSEYEVLIKDIAFGMAKFLKNEHNRNVLKKELNKSNYVEKILEVTEFLNKTKSIYVNREISERTILDGIADNIIEKDAFIKRINKLEFGLIDIYLPLEKWRKEWSGSENLLVAAVGYRENDDKSDILAYDLNGEKVFLSATEIPQLPTLVIYPSEKMGVYNNNNNKVMGKLNNNNSITSNIDYKVQKIIIHKDYDSGWFGGTMEIFFNHRSKFKYFPGSWGGWEETGTVNNVQEDKWKTCNKLLETSIHELIFNIEVWEWDGWFNGGNDEVCDSFYDRVYDSNGNDNYQTHDIWNDLGMATRTLVDGTNIHSNYYDEIVVTYGVE